ncbi:ankyrin repeat-containing protein BDA1-like [Juglans microcarpa x Juglans regia]|uniref:ankyrin repeat-containing protein BDA1-like n=1 Tax=Juglans microcarpa x Juglans regia TaxID=2249226 RepID=UPI001B7DF2F1|nr:ankyrin repeat-containing protein BDA1-like [Juglans microcarpa x Juglans regia]
MDPELKCAAEEGNIELLYDSIRKHAKVLDDINEISFVDTPLHVAASAGRTRFAMEIAMLKPSFATRLNQDGFTPMHLALQYDHTDLVFRLIDVDKDLVRVQGKGGATPLHYVAQTGNLHLLHAFLQVCPKSLEVVTTQRETALHIALKHNRFDAFEYLVGWLRRAWFRHADTWERKLLNWGDDEGNTMLHIAVSRNLPQVVKCLVNCASVEKNIKNSEGYTALDILQHRMMLQVHDYEEIKDLLCRAGALSASFVPDEVPSLTDYFRSPISIYERFYIRKFRQRTKLTNEVRNLLLVAATLVIAVAYQSAVCPPGGVWQDNSHPGIDQFNKTTKINANNNHESARQRREILIEKEGATCGAAKKVAIPAAEH